MQLTSGCRNNHPDGNHSITYGVILAQKLIYEEGIGLIDSCLANLIIIKAFEIKKQNANLDGKQFIVGFAEMLQESHRQKLKRNPLLYICKWLNLPY